MEDKRTFLAIGLCLAVMVGWSYFGEFMGWTPPPAQPTTQTQNQVQTNNAVSPAATAPLAPVQTLKPSEGREVRVETPLYSAVLYSGGGILRSFQLKNYAADLEANSPPVELVSQNAALAAPLGLVLNGQPTWSTGQWSFTGDNLNLAEGNTASLTFVGETDGIRVSRVLTFSADSYLINENVILQPLNETPRTALLGFTLSVTPFAGESSYDPTRIAWNDNGTFEEDTDIADLTESGFQTTGTLPWGGVMSNFFMTMIAPQNSDNLTMKGRIENGVWRVGIETPLLTLTPAANNTVVNNWWFGPKDRNVLSSAPNDLSAAVNYGFFTVIARPLVAILEFFHGFVANWGVAILLLTLGIRIAFWPLSQKSYKSMEQMKKIQPMMLALREKYADDKTALNREVMQLYKTYNVNPASGCLPILIQIPVFIGLYQALLNSIELRHAAFITYLPFTDIVWLADLSTKDPFYITPILMGVSMVVQQRLSPPVGDPVQQKVMMFLPIIFTVMFLNFPSGLVLYWLCNNVLSIAQQWWMLRKISTTP